MKKIRYLICYLVLELCTLHLVSAPPERMLPSRFNLSVSGGKGLIRVLSPYTLESGEIAAGYFFMNYDRHPGDIDFMDHNFQFAIGLPGNTELFFQLSPILRTNSVGQDPVGYPVPPLDLFIDLYPEPAQRAEPYFLHAQEAPFKTYFVPNAVIRPPGDGAFASSSGDNTIGFKINLFSEERDHCYGLGLRAYAEFPTETPEYNSSNWRKLAGVSGERDYGLDLLFAKKRGSMEFLANVGYKKIGDPDRGMRVQIVNSAFDDPESFLVGDPVETKLDLKDHLLFGAGFNVPLIKYWGQQAWFVSEFSYTRYIGSGTPVERLVHPAEMRLGIQFIFPGLKSVSAGAAWQLLFNDAGDGGQRSSNLVTPDGQRGDINFGELVDPALWNEVGSFFTQRGATFSENSSKVFVTNNSEFDSWRNISTGPKKIIGQGGGGVVFFATWHIAKLW
jgi:hypothetical protein